MPGAVIAIILAVGIWAMSAQLVIAQSVSQCEGYGPPAQVGTLRDPLSQISGMVESQYQYQGQQLFWVHNDGSGAAEAGEVAIYLIRPTGDILARVRVRAPADEWPNEDWEAMAVGEYEGKRILYIGDIGDNNGPDESAIRLQIAVYAVEEPEIKVVPPFPRMGTVTALRYPARYPDRRPRDAESMFVDTETGKICILTKRDRPPQIYCYPDRLENLEPGVVVDLERIAFSPPQPPEIPALGTPTDATNSLDGSVAIRSDWTIHIYYREKGESLEEIFSREPLRVVADRDPQGEAIAFDHSEDPPAIITTGEFGDGGTSAPIHRSVCRGIPVTVNVARPPSTVTVYDPVRIEITASSSVPIIQAELWVDGRHYDFAERVTEGRYVAYWEAGPVGRRELTARAFDQAWNQQFSDSVVVTVVNPPE